MSKVLVIAPHPDDETLGCGGTLLRHKLAGDEIFWLIATQVYIEQGFSEERVKSRQEEIERVGSLYGFKNVYQLEYATMKLDEVPMSNLVTSISNVFKEIEPAIVYVPYRDDAHTDHKYVFDAAAACTKWFRYPYIRKVAAYETVSETEFGLNPSSGGFRPNLYVDISNHTKKKWEIMSIYQSEIAEFPFPRSKKGLEALERYRGMASNCEAAEAFMLLKEII